MTFMNLDSLTPLKEKLANHRIFERINSIQELKVFMEHHIFAVWDFMSLLKKLQIDLVPSGSPWVPNSNGNLVFRNPLDVYQSSETRYDEPLITVPIQEKDLIIFPSFLLHKTEVNELDDERIIVSMNLEGRKRD